MGNTNATDNIAGNRIIVAAPGTEHWSGSGAALASRYIRGTVGLSNGNTANPAVGRIESCSFSEISGGSEELDDGANGVEAYDFFKLGWKVQLTARFRAGDVMPRIGEVFTLNMPEGGIEDSELRFVCDGEPKVDWGISSLRKVSFSGKMHASMALGSLLTGRVRSDNSTAAQTTTVFNSGDGFGDALPTEPTFAAGLLTSTGTNVSVADTVTIGTTVYTFKSSLAAAYDVKIGATAAESLENLKKAINATGTAGTHYFTGTLVHPSVTAGTLTTTTLVVTANTPGTGGNAIASTEVAVTLSWGSATLVGGTGPAADPLA